MNDVKPLRCLEFAAQGVYIHHCSYLFDYQTKDRVTYHQSYRLRKLNVGIQILPKILWNTSWAERWLQPFWMSPRLVKVRKKRDKNSHHDYFEKIWKTCDKNTVGIEQYYGFSPGSEPFWFTMKFEGKHPENINHRYPEARS
jgi:hypothetical protein